MADRVGEQFGEYRLARKLGGGTFGDVYLGEHIRDNTPSAVKVLQARLTHAEDLKDFINEVRTLFRLQHPSIVPLLDFGIERDTPFLIMAYAPHGALRQPKGTQLPMDAVVTYIRQVAEALQCAHDRRLIHRDVKPDNILLGPNSQVWLSDFGITTIAHSSILRIAQALFTVWLPNKSRASRALLAISTRLPLLLMNGFAVPVLLSVLQLRLQYNTLRLYLHPCARSYQLFRSLSSKWC